MTSSAASPSVDREQSGPDRPETEQARLQALRRYEIVGTEPEPNFDRITRVAASFFDVPIALINFIAEDQQWYKSAVGVESGGRSLEPTFCLEAIRSGRTTTIEDAAESDQFSDHPLVEGPPGVRFYAGTPLETLDGHLLGTLCVLDTDPRQLSDEEADRLEDLAEMVMSELERRREIREKLQEKDERLQSIAENVSDGIYRSTAEEGIVYANQAFVEMFGYQDLEELKAAGGEALYADLARREKLIEKEVENGRLDREEVRFRRKDGTTFVGLLSSQQVEGEDQGKTYFDGAITDITERKRHEQKLKRRRQDIEALYETTRGLFRAESREAVYDRIHGVLRRVFDYDLVSTETQEKNVIRPVRTDRSGGVEVPVPGPHPADDNSIAARVLQDGETTVVTDLNSPENDIDYGALRSAAGVPIGEQGVVIVGRVGEKSFDRFNLRLVEVLAGYAALVLGRLEREDKLRGAKEEAEDAARLKASMLANMSHEIRTPLTSIIGFAEAIGKEVDGRAKVARFAGLIEGSGQRLLDTLDAVLNLSKLEAGQMGLESRPVDLAEQAERIADQLRPQAEDDGLALMVEAGSVETQADEGGVQIVLQNLLSNAIKYTGEGGEVRVRVYQNENEAILDVEDTGIGMEPEVAETLFEPFRQASEGLDREYEGTGIGLAVVRRAVEQMDGTVDVETEKGEGSRFTVRLPRTD